MESSVPSVRNIGETKPDRRQRSPHRRSSDPALRSRLRGLPLIAVLALATLLTLKLEFRNPDANTVFYAYGITVTTVILVTMTVSFAFYRDPAVVARAGKRSLGPSGVQSSDEPLVTCVVAVHNEEVLVRQCIASMAAQTYPNKEIIVVDDASTDNTASVLRELAQKYPFTLIELPANCGKKRALAAGLLQAHGSIIAFSDSDSVWARDAVELAVPIFLADDDVGAVSGHCRALNGGTNVLTRIQDSWYEGQFSVRKAFESVFGAVTCVSGPLAFFRLSAIYNFMPAWGADTFLGQEFRFATDRTLTAFVLGGSYLGPRVLPQHSKSPFAHPQYPVRDWKIVYSKSSKSWTNVPSTFKGMIRQQVRWKKSFIRNIFVTGRFYWRRPFLPALFYYVHVGFVILGPFISARHLIYLPLHGDPMSMVLYLVGIAIIGLSFGLAFRHENPGSRRWLYRPLMSLMSTVIFTWLIFYSAATIKRMTWFRG
jgi:cellulose synthase/poly-beta-1,6-N-acetylglucosamine synthase-like glycosyltransferase